MKIHISIIFTLSSNNFCLECSKFWNTFSVSSLSMFLLNFSTHSTLRLRRKFKNSQVIRACVRLVVLFSVWIPETITKTEAYTVGRVNMWTVFADDVFTVNCVS